MAEGINLIPETEQKEQQKVKIVRSSSVITILMLLVAVGVSAYFFYDANKLQTNIEEQNTLIENYRQDISQMSDIEIEARKLDAKYKILEEIYSTNRNYSILLHEFDKRLPYPNVKVESFVLGGENLNTINVSGNGDKYLFIATFMNTLIDTNFNEAKDGLEDLFTEVTLTSVDLDSQTEGADYNIVVNFSPEKLN